MEAQATTAEVFLLLLLCQERVKAFTAKRQEVKSRPATMKMIENSDRFGARCVSGCMVI